MEEEDVYNKVYWVSESGNELDEEERMLVELLGSVTMNCLLNVEDNGTLEGSAKIILKCKGENRQKYIK